MLWGVGSCCEAADLAPRRHPRPHERQLHRKPVLRGCQSADPPRPLPNHRHRQHPTGRCAPRWQRRNDRRLMRRRPAPRQHRPSHRRRHRTDRRKRRRRRRRRRGRYRAASGSAGPRNPPRPHLNRRPSLRKNTGAHAVIVIATKPTTKHPDRRRAHRRPRSPGCSNATRISPRPPSPHVPQRHLSATPHPIS